MTWYGATIDALPHIVPLWGCRVLCRHFVRLDGQPQTTGKWAVRCPVRCVHSPGASCGVWPIKWIGQYVFTGQTRRAMIGRVGRRQKKEKRKKDTYIYERRQNKTFRRKHTNTVLSNRIGCPLIALSSFMLTALDGCVRCISVCVYKQTRTK